MTNYVDTPEPGEFDRPTPVAKPTPLTTEYKGYTIEFPTVDKPRFHVVDGLDGSPWFDSYDGAITAIKRQIDADAKASIANLKINHVGVTEEGLTITITGINRGNGEAKVSFHNRADKRSYDGTIYPDEPWVREALEKVSELREYQKKLSGIGVRGKRHYGFGRISAASYPRELERLEEELTAAATKAKEGGE